MVGAERERRAPPSVAPSRLVYGFTATKRVCVCGAVADVGHQHAQAVERRGLAARDRGLSRRRARRPRARRRRWSPLETRVAGAARAAAPALRNASGCERTCARPRSRHRGRRGNARRASPSRRRSRAAPGTAGRASRQPAPRASSRSAARRDVPTSSREDRGGHDGARSFGRPGRRPYSDPGPQLPTPRDALWLAGRAPGTERRRSAMGGCMPPQ